ncbi:hypothetical protein BZG36_01742 [Bifiguratus adelaidae]|uniref:Uncharacterized protein n=1 Tax=Bifiguratus adelaidae TaxID=1938954 RepID=A0A261Y338_9FUNG|nr:hypothetical protein BZG36_01742 [Bifiguratus adelaidae]
MSDQKQTLLSLYLAQLAAHPLRTKALTAGALNFLQEASAIRLSGMTPGRDGTIAGIDKKTVQMALYGLLISGPLGHVLFEQLQKAFAGRTGTRAKVEMILAQNLILSPIQNSVFIAAMAVIAGARTLDQIIHAVKRGLLPMQKVSWVISPLTMRRTVEKIVASFWGRFAYLILLPVAIVIAWCAVPIPFDKPSENDSPSLIGSLFASTTSSTTPQSSFINNAGFLGAFHLPSHTPGSPVDINFWFFVFWYYGIYNAIGLLFVTKLFSIYALNWWPKALGGLLSFLLFWSLTEGVGVVLYFFVEVLTRQTLTWVGLTFLTMSMPLCVAFGIIQSQSRNRYRHSLTPAQKTFSIISDRRIPASYRRFLWFCLALFIALLALVAGEGYAYLFLSTLPHKAIDAFVYVYSWIGFIYFLDLITDWIIEVKIRSYPIASIFKLYFFMIYFIFYRNLFARLRSIDQFVLIQVGSSLWVCIFYPITMTNLVYSIVTYFGTTLTYEQYQKKIGRSFYLRNLAENVTMLGFLCWLNVIHFGPNLPAYPYFRFDDVNTEGNPYTYQLTFLASLGVWLSELISSFITRLIFRLAFRRHITKEAVNDFKQYPEMMVAFTCVMVHVMQDMLLALLKLNFA